MMAAAAATGRGVEEMRHLLLLLLLPIAMAMGMCCAWAGLLSFRLNTRARMAIDCIASSNKLQLSHSLPARFTTQLPLEFLQDMDSCHLSIYRPPGSRFPTKPATLLTRLPFPFYRTTDPRWRHLKHGTTPNVMAANSFAAHITFVLNDQFWARVDPVNKAILYVSLLPHLKQAHAASYSLMVATESYGPAVHEEWPAFAISFFNALDVPAQLHCYGGEAIEEVGELTASSVPSKLITLDVNDAALVGVTPKDNTPVSCCITVLGSSRHGYLPQEVEHGITLLKDSNSLLNTPAPLSFVLQTEGHQYSLSEWFPFPT